jgi:hypothetical protein
MHRKAKSAVHDLVLSLRETLEGEIKRALAAYGIRAEGAWTPADEVRRLTAEERDVHRPRIEAAINREQTAGLDQADAVAAFIRETAYTHMNRLLGLKCLEVRDLIDETITTRLIYSGRSKRHRDYLDDHPRAHRASDRGLIPMLKEAYAEVSRHIGVVFDPESEYSIIWPRHTALKDCVAEINALDAEVAQALGRDPETMPSVYADDTILGWVYQYFQEEEKDRVFRELSTKQISGYDIVPATTIYTEHYMVQFLVENSLGALWMEMHPNSKLCEAWDYFVEDPNLQNDDGTRRRGRDVRPVTTLALLDPAAGSGHFLLYAFDLFAQMYEAEARMGGERVDRPAIARRILRENLHGIDIDERAIQIAALNLYMKACTYAGVRLAGLRNGEPLQMNLVCANIVLRKGPELDDLLARFKNDPWTQELIETLWEGLQNARELGSLLKVDEQIDALITRKREAEKGTFWEHPEELWDQWKRDFLKTLKAYVDRAAETFDVNRRMFGQEAIKGVQLLDLLTRRYDVVTTNPPYMGDLQMGPTLKKLTKSFYPQSASDLYAAFIERCLQLTAQGQYTSMITQQAFMFNVDSAELRTDIVQKKWIRCLAHLGARAFEEISGEKVNTAMFSFRSVPPKDRQSMFFRLLDAQTSAKKEATLRHLVQNQGSEAYFEVRQADLQSITEMPIVYWITPAMLFAFKNLGRVTQLISPKAGLSTGDNPRFIRYWWELPPAYRSTNRWSPCMSGGQYTRWYRSPPYLIDWQNDGERIKNFRHADGRQRSAVRNEEFYFEEGLIFLKNGTIAFSPWYTSGDCVFLDTNRFIQVKSVGIFYALGFLNSAFVDHALNLLDPTGGFSHTNIERIPYKPPQEEEGAISEIAERSVNTKRKLLSFQPEDREFEYTGLESKIPSREPFDLSTLYEIWLRRTEDIQLELLLNKAMVDQLVFDAYDLDNTQIEKLMRFESLSPGWHPILKSYDDITCEVLPTVEEFLNHLPERSPSKEELDMLRDRLIQSYENYGKSLESISEQLQINPISIVALRREMGLINPDDLKHEVENFLTHRIWELCKREGNAIIPYERGLRTPPLLAQVRGEIEAVFGAENAVAIEAEMDEILGRGGLAGWLEDPFFKKHRSQFKRRPILWQITSRDKHFRVLLYYHKLDHDTLPSVRAHYLWPLLERAQTQLRLERQKEEPDVKTVGELETYIADLQDCDRRLERVIQGDLDVDLPDWAIGPYRNGQPPYNPDLDDGVKVNLLPLQAAGILPYKKVV